MKGESKVQMGCRRLAGQMGIMEYMMMTLFVMVIIVMLVFFFSGWQISQVQMQESRAKSDLVLSGLKNVMYSPLLVRESGMFDDAKLSALQARCDKVKAAFGADIYIEVSVLDGRGDIPCDPYRYDINCNYWSVCMEDRPHSALVMPVNVYRNMGNVLSSGVLGRTDLAVLKVGVYETQ